MRDVAETRGKGDFGDGFVTRVAIEQIARARNNPLLVDVLAHRAAGCRKQAVHIAFGAAESRSQCSRAELRVVAVMIDMVKHHRQQHGDMHAFHRCIGENFWRMRDQIDHVRADQCRGFWELTVTQAELGIAGERSGESTAGFGPGQVEPRALEQPFRQKLSRYGKAEQFEVLAVGDLERLCRIRKRQITRRTDLLTAALRGTSQPFELEVDKAEIIRAQGNVRSEAKHGVPCGCDQRYLYRSGINPRDCAFKGLVSNPSRLKSYEGSREVVSPTSKGLTCSQRLGRPFHEHPEQIAIAKGPRQSKGIAGGEDGQRHICADQHGNLPNQRTAAYMPFPRDRSGLISATRPYPTTSSDLDRSSEPMYSFSSDASRS